ncbi:MAG: methionyl-tRNA formyltransferase [Flavobacteriaceae bacterium]|nr:MAG: methionyl-tRNA formyltransferase [Flavobacteriaceae bacterium]
MNLVENLEYNTERSHLIIPEYGRHFQKMVDHAVSIADRDERNKVAQSIISVMGNLQPHLRDVPDFQHKLWDQLFIMSNFNLEVDSPFPITTEEMLKERPEPLDYPQNFPKYRFYGNNIKRMVDVAISWEKGNMRDGLEYAIANHMKKCYLNWNKDTVDDSAIFKHLMELSDGKIDLAAAEVTLTDSAQFLKNKLVKSSRSNTGKKHQNQRNNNNRGKKRY